MNTVPEYTEEIARLILQRISGTIGEEEAGLLDAWAGRPTRQTKRLTGVCWTALSWNGNGGG